MANGYMGKILWVDLSRNSLQEEPLDERLCRDYIGGYGLGAWLLYSRQKAGVDSLGPENTLGFLTGPFTGTQALGGSRYVVVAKSPLTGTWGDANSGGNFGPYLKFTGYDAVFITGIAAKPVYLFINDGKAEIKDASHLWGKDCYQTEDILKGELGKDIEVAIIGPSGEGVSLIAAILTDKGRAAARSGLGAVMGAKRLKAVVAKGNMKVPVFDSAKTAALRKQYLPELTGPINFFKEFGTPAFTVGNAQSGDSPVKNWAGAGETDFPQATNLDAKYVIERQQKKYGCYRCPIACGGHMKEGNGEYRYQAGVHKPEYETICMFGTNCLNDNLESIIKANDLCNRYGLDTISAGSCIAFAIECYENGLISQGDTGGIEMTWGNHRSIVAMLEKTCRREGFGAVLADGVRVAAGKIGKGAEKYAMHIQGQEYPAHDPRFSSVQAVTYRMDATPGHHMREGGIARNCPGVPATALAPDSPAGRADTQRIGVAYNHVVDSVGCCQVVKDTYPDAGVLTEFLNALTGWNFTMDDVIKAGERIANIRHVFNLREGLNPLKYANPDRIVGKPPLKAGPLAGKTIDEAALDGEFCKAMGWDTTTAKPTKKRLLELGMADVAGELYPA